MSRRREDRKAARWQPGWRRGHRPGGRRQDRGARRRPLWAHRSHPRGRARARPPRRPARRAPGRPRRRPPRPLHPQPREQSRATMDFARVQSERRHAPRRRRGQGLTSWQPGQRQQRHGRHQPRAAHRGAGRPRPAPEQAGNPQAGLTKGKSQEPDHSATPGRSRGWPGHPRPATCRRSPGRAVDAQRGEDGDGGEPPQQGRARHGETDDAQPNPAQGEGQRSCHLRQSQTAAAAIRAAWARAMPRASMGIVWDSAPRAATRTQAVPTVRRFAAEPPRARRREGRTPPGRSETKRREQAKAGHRGEHANRGEEPCGLWRARRFPRT